MTNEEAKTFLDNLKVCIEEHPIVADWLVEIAGRKTENSSGFPTSSEPKAVVGNKAELTVKEGAVKVTPIFEDEPQTERSNDAE